MQRGGGKPQAKELRPRGGDRMESPPEPAAAYMALALDMRRGGPGGGGAPPTPAATLSPTRPPLPTPPFPTGADAALLPAASPAEAGEGAVEGPRDPTAPPVPGVPAAVAGATAEGVPAGALPDGVWPGPRAKLFKIWRGGEGRG